MKSGNKILAEYSDQDSDIVSFMSLEMMIDISMKEAVNETSEDILYLIGRLETIKDHVDSGNNHMAIAMLMADISALTSSIKEDDIKNN